MEKIHGVRKVSLQFNKIFFVSVNATAESVNRSLFLKNVEKYFYDLTYKKKLCQTHRKFTTFSLLEKFIGDNG